MYKSTQEGGDYNLYMDIERHRDRPSQLYPFLGDVLFLYGYINSCTVVEFIIWEIKERDKVTDMRRF